MAEEKPRLGRDVYIALAAVGWADGNLDQEEADAIVRKNLSKEDRLFVYAVACWLTRLDGLVTEEETKALADLAEALKIPEKPRGVVDGIAQDIANRGDDRPLRYDLLGLRRAIGDRLKSAQTKKDGE